jgi:hypothetical protein
MYQNHVDESYAVELVVGRHPEFPGSTGGKPPELVTDYRQTTAANALIRLYLYSS